MISVLLYIVYAIGMVYIMLFLTGLNLVKTPKITADKKKKINVILPIYKEDKRLIKKCLDSLLLQNPGRINLYVVTTAMQRGQIRLIESYRPSFLLLKMLSQKIPSLTKSYKLALEHVNSEYTCILNVDIVLKENAIGKLLSFVEENKLDIGFALILPIYTTIFSKLTCIEKLIRQSLLQNGRSMLKMGNYIPGAFYIARSSVLRSNLVESFTDDVALMLRAYSARNIRIDLLRTPLAYELEKKSFSSWALQYSRWFVGNLTLYKLWIKAFVRADIKLRLGILGLIYVWYILPISIAFGALSVVFLKLNVFTFLITYMVLTLSLYGIKEMRKFNPTYLVSFWMAYSFAKVCGLLLSVYIHILSAYINERSYLIYKR